VLHSEFNPSPKVTTHMLQIWITPTERRLEPSYTEWHPDPAKENEPKVLVISPDGREGSATIHQDADIYRVRLPKGQSITHEVQAGRGVWFQLIKGGVTAHNSNLKPGDAFSTEETGTLTLTASEDAEALLFDLA
jgi:redox-sensitive bicupin YhaK (pirin superfamily)